MDTESDEKTGDGGTKALVRLIEGNRRFASGVALGQGRDATRRTEVAARQEPFAVVICCSDSRVVPEIMFDTGLGDLFVLRIPGNTTESGLVREGVELGVSELGCDLVIVVGHDNCAAVTAAVEAVRSGSDVVSKMPSLVTPVLPAAREVRTLPQAQQVSAAVKTNVINQLELLRSVVPASRASDERRRSSKNETTLAGGVYRLGSGFVDLIR